MMTDYEILSRIVKFNETQDRSVFDDVPMEQQYRVKYPKLQLDVYLHVKQKLAVLSPEDFNAQYEQTRAALQ
jgi:hypothetical protein